MHKLNLGPLRRAICLLTCAATLALAACANGNAQQPAAHGSLTAQQPGAGTSAVTTAAPQPAPTVSTTPVVAQPVVLYTEVADNHRGVPVFTSPEGAAGNAPSIPYGTSVQVDGCAVNTSGMPSVNMWYHIVSPAPWQNTYAPANTFANGDTMGVTGVHTFDKAVPRCEAIANSD
jgi:hypothetical protein